MHVHCVHVPDFWLLYECYLDGLERLKQATNFIHTQVLGKLKLQNLKKQPHMNHHYIGSTTVA